jgi:hypothetical protein
MIRGTLPEGSFAEARSLSALEPVADDVKQKLLLAGLSDATVENSISTPRGPRKPKDASQAA